MNIIIVDRLRKFFTHAVIAHADTDIRSFNSIECGAESGVADDRRWCISPIMLVDEFEYAVKPHGNLALPSASIIAGLQLKGHVIPLISGNGHTVNLIAELIENRIGWLIDEGIVVTSDEDELDVGIHQCLVIIGFCRHGIDINSKWRRSITALPGLEMDKICMLDEGARDFVVRRQLEVEADVTPG